MNTAENPENMAISESVNINKSKTPNEILIESQGDLKALLELFRSYFEKGIIFGKKKNIIKKRLLSVQQSINSNFLSIAEHKVNLCDDDWENTNTVFEFWVSQIKDQVYAIKTFFNDLSAEEQEVFIKEIKDQITTFFSNIDQGDVACIKTIQKKDLAKKSILKNQL